MNLKLYAGPAIEPVSVQELKDHLKIDSVNFADSLTSVQSIAPGSHAPAAAYSLKGAGVNVLNQKALVLLEAGTCGAGASIIVKIQESDTDSDAAYTDVIGAVFTTVTEANDNATFEYEYTGTKHYIRTVATVAVAASEFGVSIVTNSPFSFEETVLQGFITAARTACEKYQDRSYNTQTWDLYMNDWPKDDIIKVPRAPLQSVGSIKFYGIDGTEYTFDPTLYHVSIASDPGRVVLAWGCIWPVTPLKTVDGIIIRFISGYGATAEAVPENIRLAIKMLAGHFYENREMTADHAPAEIPAGVQMLLGLEDNNLV